MTIEELIQKLGIADDKREEASKTLHDYLDGNYVTKSRFNEVNEEKKTLKTTVAERDKQLETLKNSKGDTEALKAQIKQLQTENNQAKEKYEDQMKNLKLTTAIQLAIGDSAQDVGIVSGLFDRDKLILGEDGKVTGLDEQDASVQTLVDAASRFGFYIAPDKEEDAWIGIPLWVHRRCQYPMFTIANKISYHDFMVQGVKQYGKTAWFDVKGKAVDKYVKEQGEFLKQKLKEMIAEDPEIIDPTKKDKVYIISPFRNVAYKLAQLLKSINFTRTQGQKATNIGTVHTFQGKEAAIVFLVLGADEQSKSAANWAVDEPNIMNVAATRAKKEFYIIGDKKMYGGLGSDVIRTTLHSKRKINQWI
ncbi:putative uncharacterized protein [Megasphaera elsdenii CAG:570]|uniref:DNA2/NAM7 helicase-like C-terminal domain-containing protein n=1 Tax=Megasphaera elsdenii CAG:570 TaxID=1263087 RepID=R7MX41_MEGEL|nr:putative uncharacterized protein [Megasphaera elsdenii CAG:570]